MLSAGSLTSDPRRVAMETYWREVQSIEEEQEEDEERKSLDELELEEAWLVQSGLSALTLDPDLDLDSEDHRGSKELQNTSRPVEALLSTLTRRQTDTVRHRLLSYTATLRQRNRPITDVRCVFTQTDSEDDSDSPPVGPESPKRFHTSTRTIRRHNNRVRPRPPLSKLIVEAPPSPASPAPPNRTPPSEPSRVADWLFRDTPYSEGVAEHRRGVACGPDCICFHDSTNNANDADEEPSWFSPDLGLSSAEDLSELDLRNISFIAHIELYTMLQSLDQNPPKTRVHRRRSKDGAVFGVPLKTLLENDRKKHPGLKTPLVFSKLLQVLDQTGLQTEGILRISGSVSRLKSLRRDLDRGSDLDWSGLRPVDAAGLLKMFVRELPTPLLHAGPQTVSRIRDLQCELHQLQALQLLCLVLPESHRYTLQALLSFLWRVVANQEKNRMSLWNVSMVMAPNLLLGDRRQDAACDATQEMEEAVGGAKLVRLLIHHRDLMITVPCFLLAQVRRMNQASNQRRGLSRTRRRLQYLRKHPEQDLNNAPPLSDDVIRVRAPLQLKVSTAMKLDATTTARDVTERFPRDVHSGETLRLYEVGGNIGERRLHPGCFLLDVYRENPGCDWLIKP